MLTGLIPYMYWQLIEYAVVVLLFSQATTIYICSMLITHWFMGSDNFFLLILATE